MSDPAAPGASRADWLDRPDLLLVLRPLPDGAPELYLGVDATGQVTAFSGHVDLGTGVRTALAQIVAEELDVAIERVALVLGHSALAPDQGPTIASETIQVTAQPLRRAAAQARHHLLALAADTLGRPAGELTVREGVVMSADDSNLRIEIGELVRGRSDRLALADQVPVKAAADYALVGRSTPRVDIPAKATGEWTYVHDVRLPAMLHGRVVRPPYAGLDSGEFVGASLISVDEASVASLPGLVAVVVVGDFVGVVAEREEEAAAAAEQLLVRWRTPPPAADLGDVATALLAQPSSPRTLKDTGGVDAALAAADQRLTRRYVWPYQMHGSIGPSCAVADWRDDRLTVWSGTQNPLPLRADLSLLLALPAEAIEVVRLEAAGCYGRNCADDVSADAALLSRAVGRPVRVQLTRAQEHLWEPKGAAQLIEVDGGLTAVGVVAAYDFSTRYPSNAAPTLALLLTGVVPPQPQVLQMGDRTAIPPYRLGEMRVVVHDMAPIVRAAWLRGVSALPNSFAHESYIDELATAAGVDPVEFRLRHLDDARGADLVRSVADEAQWQPRTGPRLLEAREGVARGQGVAYARYVHGPFPGTAAAWSAWVAEVEVAVETGEVSVTRVVVGQDNGLTINPAGVRHQIHGNVIQSVSRTIKEEVAFDRGAVASREWGAYPILTFPETPVIQVVLAPRPEEPPLGAGESASVPSAAAIANAIFDATGVRMREPPFTPERVRQALLAAKGSADASKPRRGVFRRWLPPMLAGAVAAFAALWPWRPAIAPIAPPDPGRWSAETLEQGRKLAALGDCAVCHTREGGIENAGGRPLETPFGVIHTTNITPDVETGIGAWSYPAFARAMREGVHRDGRRLYPAFPYTAFTKSSEADLEALYAWLMSRPAVRAEAPKPELRFPFNLRPLLAGWNALFLKLGAFQPDPARSPDWNRGAYLVEGLGHCGGCHSPRNLLGAEQRAARLYTGGFAEGWEAPPLTRASHAPLPWSEADLFAYLRHGFSPRHGAAAGPMGPVVEGLTALPDADIRAMAHYLASFNESAPAGVLDARAEALEARARSHDRTAHTSGARIYDGACAVCHDAAAPDLYGVKASLALNSNLHSARPDNLLRAILEGAAVPGKGELGAMPGFKGSLDDRQVAELAGYLRARFAPDQPAWRDLASASARIRTGAPRR